MAIKVIRLRDSRSWEAGAQLLAVLAWPTETAERQAHYAKLICAWFVSQVYENEPEWAETDPHIFHPKYTLRVDAREIEKTWRIAHRRLEHAGVVGHIGIAFMQEAAGVQPLFRPEINGRATIDKLIGHYADVYRVNDTNFRKRYWTPYTSVLHLAAAWAMRASDARRNGEEAPSVCEFMSSYDHVLDLFCRAFEFERLVGLSRPLKFIDKTLLRLRLDILEGSLAA